MSAYGNQPARRPSASVPTSRGGARTVSPLRYIEEQEQLSWGDSRLDRRLESRGMLELRQQRRDAEVGAGQAAADAAVAAAEVEAKRKYLYEVKQQLARASQESELLARGDIALTANFSALDDDLYRFARMRGLDLD